MLFQVISLVGAGLVTWVAVIDERLGFIILEGAWARLSCRRSFAAAAVRRRVTGRGDGRQAWAVSQRRGLCPLASCVVRPDAPGEALAPLGASQGF